MRTDLNSLKKELTRLTDIKYLKKEINRIATEVKSFDMQRFSPRAKVRIENLEERFRDALNSLKDLQRQVDENLDRFVSLVRSRTNAIRAKRTASAGRNGSAKKAPRKAPGKKKSPRKARKRARN